MATLIIDADLEQRLLEQRRAWGADRYDEVWEGIYVMSPMPNNEHQGFVGALSAVYQVVVGWNKEGEVFPGANISDQEDSATIRL